MVSEEWGGVGRSEGAEQNDHSVSGTKGGKQKNSPDFEVQIPFRKAQAGERSTLIEKGTASGGIDPRTTMGSALAKARSLFSLGSQEGTCRSSDGPKRYLFGS